MSIEISISRYKKYRSLSLSISLCFLAYFFSKNIYANEISSSSTTTTYKSLRSNMHRDVGSAQMSQEEEAVNKAGEPYTNSSTGRAVPDILKDDDGHNASSPVVFVDRTGWSNTTCGTVGSIEDRIADCAIVFGGEATWDGAVKANSGQGVWKLVTRTDEVVSSRGREVWRDESTKLLWSSKVASSTNWCKATGSNNIAGNPTAEVDPDNYCDNATYQNTVGKAISACFEDGESYFTGTDGDIDGAGKAGLGYSSTPLVAWRLPTIYDYQQANINGLRFVVPDMAAISSVAEWSATVRSDSRMRAWRHWATGSINFSARANLFPVRCVGR